MEFVHAVLPNWVIAEIIWNHNTIMPWIGYVLAVFVLVLGPIWLWYVLRRVGRAIQHAARGLLRWLSVKKPVARERKSIGPSGMRGGEGWVVMPPEFFVKPDE